MADRYWVGTSAANRSGFWDSNTYSNWSATSGGAGGVSTPTASDNVIIDQPGPYTITLSTNPTCNSFTISAENITFAFNGLTLSVNGTTFYIDGTTIIPTSTGTLTLQHPQGSTGQTKTLTTNGVTIPVTVVIGGTFGVLSTWVLAGTLTIANSKGIYFYSGTLDLNGFNITTGWFWSQTNTASSTRTLNQGESNIYITGAGINADTAPVLNKTTGQFIVTGNTSASPIFYWSGQNVGIPDLIFTYTGTIAGTCSFMKFASPTSYNSFWQSIDFGTVTLTATTSTAYLGVVNTLKLSPNMTALLMRINGLSSTLNTSGVTISELYLGGGTTTLASALTIKSTSTIGVQHRNAVLDLNGFNLTTPKYEFVSNLYDRTLNFNGGNIYLVGNDTVPLLASNVTVPNSGTFYITSSTTVTQAFQGVGNNVSLVFTGTGGPYAVAFSSDKSFNNLNFGIGTYSSIFSAGNYYIYGALTISPNTTSTGPSLYFEGPNASYSDTGGALTVGSIYIGANSVTGPTTVFTLLSSLKVGNNGIWHSKGTFNLNNFNIITGQFGTSGTSAKVIQWGTSTVTLNHTTAGTSVLSMADLTNYTYSGIPSFISDASITRTYQWGGVEPITSTLANAPNLKITSGASFPTILISNIRTLDLTGSTCSININTANVSSLILGDGTYTASNVNIAGTGTINSNGKTINILTINNPGGTTTLTGALTCSASQYMTLTAGTLNLNNFTLTGGLFQSNNSNVRGINFGTGNIALSTTINGASVINMATMTNFSCTATTGGFTISPAGTRNYQFGTTAGGTASNSPNLTFGTASTVQTITTGGWLNKLDFGTTAFTVPTTSLNLNGLILSDTGIYTALTPTMRGTGLLNTNGNMTFTTLIIDSTATATTTLASAVTTSASTTLTTGTLALAGFTLTTTDFHSGTATTRAISGAGTGVISLANEWNVTQGAGFTGSDYTINMTKATAKLFRGSGGSYGTLVQAGAGTLTISGSNTFADIQATTRPSTITFTAGTTQTVQYLTLSGTLGNLVTINSSTVGNMFNLSKIGGTVDASYLNIQDSNGTGGATWNAYNGTNTNSGNTSGWAFVVYVPPLITGEFMVFF